MKTKRQKERKPKRRMTVFRYLSGRLDPAALGPASTPRHASVPSDELSRRGEQFAPIVRAPLGRFDARSVDSKVG